MPRGRARPTLKPVAMPGQQYGAGVDAIQAQNVIPLPNAQATQAPQPPTQANPAMPAGGPTAQQVLAQIGAAPRAPIVPLDAPTANPGEHVMTGAPMGPGPGPEVLTPPLAPPPGSRQDLATQVRAIYAKYQNPNLLALLANIESNTPATPTPFQAR